MHSAAPSGISQLPANSLRGRCPVRLVHPGVCSPAGGRAAPGSLTAGGSDLRRPISHCIAADTRWSLRSPLADRRDCAWVQRRDAPAHHPPGADPFSGAALLVISAWCLGVLNSHRKFFLSYSAPVIWNVAIIASLLWKGGHVTEPRLAVVMSIASVIGSGLQFAVQLPTVLGFLRPLHLKLALNTEHVRTVTRNFFPVFVSRGVVQISAYIDSFLASYLPTTAVSALAYAQTLNSLPVSLFGMAISAAELPAMSSALGTQEEIGKVMRQRLENGLKKNISLCHPLRGSLCRPRRRGRRHHLPLGRCTANDVTFVWGVLAGSAVGLLATTSGRLYSSAFYALRDTRTPLNFAVIRVMLTLLLGYLFALPLPPAAGH